MTGAPDVPQKPHPASGSSYFTKPLIAVLFLGFYSGLPLALTGAKLSYWLADANVNKASIGLFGVVAMPYALKFLWAPVMDGISLPILTHRFGRRRGWMLLAQLALVSALLFLASTRPETNAWLTALAALLVAFASASQDIVIDAYRVERLTPETQGQGAAMAQLGYQLGMIAAGFGALQIAARAGWPTTYACMAALAGSGLLLTLAIREPVIFNATVEGARSFRAWVRDSVIAPFTDFMRHPDWKLIAMFIVIFKFADAFLGRMTSPFFHDLNFNKEDISYIIGLYGGVATIAGVLVGGTLTLRFGSLRVMFLAGLLHAATNLIYVWQARVGADTHLLAFGITVENFTGGVSSAAFVAYLSNLCNVHYTGTQYALLSSLAAFARTWLVTPAGWVAEKIGWEWFFAFSALLALPGLMLLLILNKRLTSAGSGLASEQLE